MKKKQTPKRIQQLAKRWSGKVTKAVGNLYRIDTPDGGHVWVELNAFGRVSPA